MRSCVRSFVCLSVCLSVCRPVCRCLSPLVFPPVCLSVCRGLSLFLSAFDLVGFERSQLCTNERAVCLSVVERTNELGRNMVIVGLDSLVVGRGRCSDGCSIVWLVWSMYVHVCLSVVVVEPLTYSGLKSGDRRLSARTTAQPAPECK